MNLEKHANWMRSAAAAREMAKKSRDPKIRAEMNEIAASYERLAKVEEERNARR